MKLIKRFYETKDLPSDNRCACQVSIIDNTIIYRDGRPLNPLSEEDVTKIFKIGKINDLVVSDVRTIYVPNNILSDPRLFKWNDKIYAQVTKITHRPGQEYLSMIDIYDIENDQLFNIKYDKAMEREKNWIFFQSGNDLLCSYSLWNRTHKVLKLFNNQLIDYIDTTYHCVWIEQRFGQIKNTSNLVLHDGLFYGIIHSAIYDYKRGIHLYRCGVVAFNATYPFNVVKCSNVPLFNTNNPQLWGNHLQIKDNEFVIGMSKIDFDHLDLISLTEQEIQDHLDKDITYEYP